LEKHGQEIVSLCWCCRIILTTDVAGVGKQGDIKAVPLGFWRNFLLPKKQAEIASEQILA
jgi:large subunit ribosomal protein L9